MSASLKPLLVLATACVTTGHFLAPAGSVWAEDDMPVAADLVELAVTLPDVISRTKFLDAEVAEKTRLSERGVASQSEVRRLQAERDAAQQKLELLRLVIQAEHEIASVRLRHANARRQGAAADFDPSEVSACELRISVLKRMLEMAKEEAPAAGEAEDGSTSQNRQPRGVFSGVVRVAGDLSSLEIPGRQADENRDGFPRESSDDQSLVVGAEGELANVFVFIRESPDGVSAPIPDEPYVLTSRDRRFDPHCAIIRVRQDVRLKNDEAVLTNMHFSPRHNPPLNYGVRANEWEGVRVRFRRTEPEPMEVTDDIYPDKRAYVLVINHPFATLTDEEGRFQIEGLPAGEFSVQFWHERTGFLDRNYRVTVSDDGDREAEIEVEADRLLSERN